MVVGLYSVTVIFYCKNIDNNSLSINHFRFIGVYADYQFALTQCATMTQFRKNMSILHKIILLMLLLLGTIVSSLFVCVLS